MASTATPRSDPQTSMDEKNLSDEYPGILKMAEEWDKREHSRKAVTSKATDSRKPLETAIDALELPLGDYRIGPITFRVKETEERDVEYTIEAGQRKLSLKASKITDPS